MKTNSSAILLALAIVLAATSALQAQSGKPKPGKTGKPAPASTKQKDDRPALLKTLVENSHDSILKVASRAVDSLAGYGLSQAKAMPASLRRFTDSLIKAAADTLDQARIDSLRSTSTALESNLSGTYSPPRLTSQLAGLLASYRKAMAAQKTEYSTCKSCSTREDYDEQIDDYLDIADSLTGDFLDTATALHENMLDNADDALYAAMDSVENNAYSLMDNHMDEVYAREDKMIDSLILVQLNAPRLEFSGSYTTHSSYNGRDNGIKQSVLGVSAQYRHPIGISVGLGTSFFSQSKGTENLDLSIGYDWALSDKVNGAIGFNRSWFKDSSQVSQAEISSSLSLSLGVDADPVLVSFDIGMDFGSQPEPTASVSALYSFDLFDVISFYPGVSAVIGAQSLELALARQNRTNKLFNKLASKNKKYQIGLMDIEFTAPFSYSLGNLDLSAGFTYVLPVNVLDSSSKSGFPSVNIGASYTFRF